MASVSANLWSENVTSGVFTVAEAGNINISARWNGNSEAGLQLQKSFDSGVTWYPVKDGNFERNIDDIIYEAEIGVQYRFQIHRNQNSPGSIDIRIGAGA